MKIRNGFVSNSSTSSFLIVGTGDDNLIRKLMNAMKIRDDEDLPEGFIQFEPSFGVHESKPFSIYGDEISYAYVGFDIEDDLKCGHTLHTLKRSFIREAKTLGLEVTEKDLNLFYGEVGDG